MAISVCGRFRIQANHKNSFSFKIKTFDIDYNISPGNSVSKTVRYVTIQASAAVHLRPLLLRRVTQCLLVVGHRRFGTVYQSHLQGPSCQRRWQR